METTHEGQHAEPLLLRIPEAARLISLGRSTIYAEISAGRLRAVHIGRAVRVRRDDLLAWLDQRTHETSAK